MSFKRALGPFDATMVVIGGIIGSGIFITSAESFHEVGRALEAKFGEPAKAGLVWRPQNSVSIDDDAGEKVLKLIESLEENDDVQNVYANFEISDALMQKMSA